MLRFEKMSQSFFFGLNNKGGVGKTSVMVDLAIHLARYGPTLFVDADLQQTGYHVLTGQEQGWCDISYYPSTRPVAISPLEANLFVEGNNNRTYLIEVDKTTIDVWGLPVRSWNCEKDETIKAALQSGTYKYVIIDLPPLISPELVLEATLLPCVEGFSREEHLSLYPVVVSDFSAPVREIGQKVLAYSLSFLRDKRYESVFPVEIINRVPADLFVYQKLGEVRKKLMLKQIYRRRLSEQQFNPDQSLQIKNEYVIFCGNDVLRLYLPQMTGNKHFTLYPDKQDLTFFFPEIANLCYRLFREDCDGERIPCTDEYYFSLDTQRAGYQLAFRRLLHEIRRRDGSTQKPTYFRVKEVEHLPPSLPDELRDELRLKLCEYYERLSFSIEDDSQPQLDITCGPFTISTPNNEYSNDREKAVVSIDCSIPLDTFLSLFYKLSLALVDVFPSQRSNRYADSITIFEEDMNRALEDGLDNGTIPFLPAAGIPMLEVLRDQMGLVTKVHIEYTRRVWDLNLSNEESLLTIRGDEHNLGNGVNFPVVDITDTLPNLERILATLLSFTESK